VLPEDPTVLSSLAAVLGLDEAETFRLSGLTPPVADGRVTVEQALRSLGDTEEPAPRRMHGEAVGRRERPPTPAGGVDLADSSAPGMAPPQPVPAATPPEAAPGSGPSRQRPVQAAPAPKSERPGVMDLLRSATVRKPRAPAPLTTLPPTPVEPSYMEDPTERWSYRMRSVMTAAGVALLLLVFGWAAANFFDAIGETWGILTSNL
jgi:hypothetical protein